MKLVIAGSRELNVSIERIEGYLKDFNLNPTAIVSGLARGIDHCGILYAGHAKLPVIPFKPDIKRYGRYLAMRLRNKKMAVEGDALLLIWDGQSGGSKHMRECMQALNKPIYEVVLDLNKQIK